MPRPPILPPVDYAAIWSGGKSYREWLAIAEEKKNADLMEARREAVQLDPALVGFLAGLQRTVHVLCIAEDWCGDVHRHVPVLEKMAEAAGTRLQTRYVSRMDHPQIFARFLTNGGEAIPKFVFFSDKFAECGNWGPMPEGLRRLIARGKGAGDVGAARKRVSQMYDADPNGEQTARELAELIANAVCTVP